jgi:hypothetical protein
MSAVQAEPAASLSTTDIARECACHPSAPVRWIQRGALLSDGRRLRLRATRLPGSWRVYREDLEQFLAALTQDRQRDDAAPAQRAAPIPQRLARLRAELAESGFSS